MRNIYLQIFDHGLKNIPVLATVAGAEGSTPQKPGSSALFNDEGLLAGTVGGGVVEGRIHKIAVSGAKSKRSGFFSFNLLNDISKKEEAICGGQISILLDADIAKNIEVFQQLRKDIDENIPGVLITHVRNASEEDAEIIRFWSDGSSITNLPDEFWLKIGSIVKSMISAADPTDFRMLDLPSQEAGDSFLLLEPVFPPLKLIIAGAGHIGRSLAHIAALLGFDVTVIDDRPEYANSGNIPDAGHIIVKEIGEAIKEIKKGPDTYLVIVTRGHKDDASALREAIGSDLAYLGMIGSRKKIISMRQEFLEKGWSTDVQWKSVNAPIGLDIKALTVEEIAVSIAAQLIMVKNAKRDFKHGVLPEALKYSE